METIVGLGARTDHLALAPGAELDRLALSAEERSVLAAIGRVATIEEILSRCGLLEAKAIGLLLGLRARGVVVPARIAPALAPAPAPAPAPAGAVDASSVEEVDLDTDRKAEILALEGLIDSASHYDILGVSPRANLEEIRSAYHEGSRRFHPDRYFQKELGGFRGRLERLFRRLSEANAVLSNPERRAAYDRAHPELFEAERATPLPVSHTAATPAFGIPDPGPPGRAEERKARLARHPYLARGRRLRDLAREAREAESRGDLDRAVEMMSDAVQLEPGDPELRSAMAELRRKHEALRARKELERGLKLEAEGKLELAIQYFRAAAAADPRSAEAVFRAASAIFRTGGDLREAKALAQRAADLQPGNASHRFVLAQVLLQADMKKLARKELEEVVRLEPEHRDAKALLRKLKWPF